MAQNTRVICLLAAAFFVVAQQLQARDDATVTRLLATKNFKLISQITHRKTGSQHVIEELYSNEQKRARISIDREESGGAGDHSVYYFESARPNLFVGHNKSPKSLDRCEYVDENAYLDTLLGYKTFSGSRGRDWLRDLGPEVPNHVVGLARLALWVDCKHDFFEQTDDSMNTKMRNINVKAYRLQKDYQGFPISNKEVIAYYPAQTPDHANWLGLPIGLWIRLPDDNWVSIVFMNVGAIKDDLEDTTNNRMPLDKFAYPVGVNCSNAMSNFQWVYKSTADLSFRMELLDYSVGQGEKPRIISNQFVAYDGETKFLRVDSYRNYLYITSILSMSHLGGYNIFQSTSSRSIERDAYGNYISHNMFDREFSQPSCIETLPLVASARVDKGFFEFRRMIPMGRARVRGVDCIALEMIANELPLTLFHHLSWTKMEGITKDGYVIGADDGGSNYNVVYYFAADPADPSGKVASYNDQWVEGNLGALMRVDVYQKGELLYHADVTEFTYNKLVDAPNGDRAKELFSVRDRCTSSEHGSLAHAKLQAELTLKIDGNLELTVKELATRLSSSSLRTQAVVRALARPSSILMLDIYDAETHLKLTDHDDELKISISARISHPDAPAVRPRLIGYAFASRPNSFPSSSTDCIVSGLAVNMDSDGHSSAVVVNCPNRCQVIPEPELEFSEDGTKIVGYSLNEFHSVQMTKVNDAHCPLLAYETQPVTWSREQKLLYLANWIHSGLHGNTLRLNLPGLELEDIIKIGDMSVPIKVDHIDISNEHWSTSVGRLGGVAELSAVERDSVDGVGLTSSSGQRCDHVIKIGSKQVPMDQNHCHSICSSKPECRSFSVCLTSLGIECITSEVDFRNAGLLEQIDSAKAELKSRTEKKTVRVPMSKGSREELELKFDLRCKIHKRNALEMFHKKSNEHMDLQNSSPIAVDSLEKCAELCWQSNLVFLNTMDKFAENLDAEKNSDESAMQLLAEWNTHKVNWCENFFYLNLAYSSDLDWVKSLAREKALDKAGLCATIKPFNNQSQSEIPTIYHFSPELLKEHPRPVFGKYEFIYSSLYEAQYGKRIVESAKSLKENRRKKVDWAETADCASACFLQTSLVQPLCKSFDFIEARLASTGTMHRYCVFHATTIEELEKEGLSSQIEEISGLNGELDDVVSLRVWHYEPKLHAMSGAMVAKKALIGTSRSNLDSPWTFEVHGLGIFLTLLASVACAAVIIKLKGDAMADFFHSPRRGSIASLTGSLNGLE